MWNSVFILLPIFLSAYAKTEEEIKAQLIKLIMKCNENGGVDISELLLLQRFVTPTQMKTKCVLACAYKASGVMTNDGLYSIEHAYKVAEEVKNGDEKRLENGRKVAEICSKVNDVQVTDGNKGCDRAALIFKCTIDNARKYGFKV